MNIRLDHLKDVIAREVFVTSATERIVEPAGEESAWIFDFRRVLLKSDILDTIAELFWENSKEKTPFQVGGVEVAAVPLIAALSLKAKEKGMAINGFFIRKSRKKSGLLRMIEGTLTDENVILVDDLMNSGNSLMRQVEILEKLNKKVAAIFVILRFRDLKYYTYFRDKGIEIYSLFSLDDFADSLHVKNLIPQQKKPVPMPFKAEWQFISERPNYFYVIPKSAPAVDNKKLYFGADNGNFWAINQKDGTVAWNSVIRSHSKGKYVFSSPAIHHDMVYFGAYDGNFYALNKETGKKEWVFREADWIGSSPCVAPSLNLIFVGLEFGLWKKRGGLVALDSENGQKKWEYAMPGLTPASPAYAQKEGMVICGCNDFSVYALDARKGHLLWQFRTGGEVKASCAIDEKRRLAAFGSFDAHVYVLNVTTGKLVWNIETREAIDSTPLIKGDYLYVASLDKKLYCIDLDTGAIVWRFAANGRIFASPVTIGDKIYIGANDGRLYELEAGTGKNTALFQATERITNKIAYNKQTGKIFLPTFANEIYCLSDTREII
ncbi:MAG: PQQ-binding-like beta-propeller repeat protein [Patescibacteria group bacterium]|mgnify:CR=1 FL=1